MSDTVIIFGAGASYDMLNVETNTCNVNARPPLTSGLFDKRFDRFVNQLDKAMNSIASIREHVLRGGNMEVYLRRLRDQAENNPEIQIALFEIQLYLQKLFQYISREFVTMNEHGAKTSNYIALLQELKCYGVKPTLITFNYDLFLDYAFTRIFGRELRTIPDYTSGDEKLYKVHGSSNWAYLLRLTMKDGFNNIKGQALALKQHDISNRIKREAARPSILEDDEEDNFFLPAISIPVPQDKEFIIPNYKDEISIALQGAKKILIIGWSASDDYFLDLIHENVVDFQTKLFLISSTRVHDIANRLDFSNSKSSKEKKWAEVHTNTTGFSGLLVDFDMLGAICQ